MIEKVVHPRNLNRAYRQVVSNGGAAGVDGMKVTQLARHLEANKDWLLETIRRGSYLPQPILGVEIPKSDGRKRLLGVPTVCERLLQQAVHQVLAPLFETDFKEGSYGFRPGRNAQQAVLKAQGFINEGYCWVVDIDLENFFDEVDHCLLLQLLYRKVKCPLTIRLIRKWLRAPILVNGKLTSRRKGVPQGSPLSPLLSNILLHELDQYLEKQRLRYVRYADDFSLYAKTPYLAQRAAKAVTEFVEGRLRLKINRHKSGIRKPQQFQLLGYSLTKTPKPAKTQKKDKSRRPQKRGSYHLIVSPKSWDKLKERLKAITRKTAPKSFDERIQEIKQVQRGWLGYFRLGSIYSRLREVDSWLRNRLRYCIWHDWKKPDRKRKKLIRLGVPVGKAYAWSRTRMGGWAVAQSPILVTTITLSRLRKRGYESLLDYYLKVAPQLNEPLYMGMSTRVRHSRTKYPYVQWCESAEVGKIPTSRYSIKCLAFPFIPFSFVWLRLSSSLHVIVSLGQTSFYRLIDCRLGQLLAEWSRARPVFIHWLTFDTLIGLVASPAQHRLFHSFQPHKSVFTAFLFLTPNVLLLRWHLTNHTNPTPCPQAEVLRWGGLVVGRVWCWQ